MLYYNYAERFFCIFPKNVAYEWLVHDCLWDITIIWPTPIIFTFHSCYLVFIGLVSSWIPFHCSLPRPHRIVNFFLILRARFWYFLKNVKSILWKIFRNTKQAFDSITIIFPSNSLSFIKDLDLWFNKKSFLYFCIITFQFFNSLFD